MSADGSRVAAVFVDDPQSLDIGVLDVRRGMATRLTHAGSNRAPVWMTDESRVLFGATLDGASGIFAADIDGSTRPLFPTEGVSASVAVTPDGRTVLYSVKARLYLGSTQSGQDKAAGRPLHDAPLGREGAAHVSPDGRWVVYLSDDSGRFEAYVHEFPGPARRERVSTGGA